MMYDSLPVAKDLVLIGGGHSHAIALKQFGMNPLSGVGLTLITDVAHTPYSGMLPGYVAGLYKFDDCHIDLRPLAQFARARMIVDQAVGLDLVNQRVLCANYPPIAFDLLSIDIGSTPATFTVPGAAEYAIPAKPISKFLAYWDQLREQIACQPERPISLAIVGGGAGGVELALGIQGCLEQIYHSTHQPLNNLKLHLFHRGNRLLPERHSWVSQRVLQLLSDRGVQVYLQETVVEIQNLANGLTAVRCASGLTVPCDRLFWVTQAGAASWLTQSGLTTNEQGFIQVSDTLQSLSHPQVFATGDVAAMVNHPRPKAGVFAVRQGKPLFENLRCALLEQPLQPFVPQKEFLILIGTGDKQAIASKGSFGFGPHKLFWRWKDYIDRQFMNQFTDLSTLMAKSQLGTSPRRVQPFNLGVKPAVSKLNPANSPQMHCAGCGSKVSSSVLRQVLQRIQQEIPEVDREDIVIGLQAAEDAAVVSIPLGQVLVQTVDYFPALIDDPFLCGKITANHCLNDLYAMGAEPQSALAVVTLPHSTPGKLSDTLYQTLLGVAQVLQEAGAVLIGGHTLEGKEFALGLTCNGLAGLDHLLRKGGLKPDQTLILTKALGTGTLFAADRQLKAKGRWIEAAVESMLQSNQAAAECFRHYQATACTDISGFGLLGHLGEMVRASPVTVDLDLGALPSLLGATETLQQKIFSSLYLENMRSCAEIADLHWASSHPLYPLLFDPQTSGGLLASVPKNQANSCLQDLKYRGYSDACIIGTIKFKLQEKFPIQVGCSINPITLR
ncbi:MAG: selenide, water dikinase SelD [Microcoleaceae cyanobacterium]